MNPITLTSGNQTIQFTNADVTIDGVTYPYSGIGRIWHIPQRSAYAVVCGEQTAAFTYEEKDLPLLQALFERIAQALQLDVEVYLPAAGAPGGEGPAFADESSYEARETAGVQEVAGDQKAAEATQGSGAVSAGMFSDKRFVIELGLGILLILLGIIGFILH